VQSRTQDLYVVKLFSCRFTCTLLLKKACQHGSFSGSRKL